MAGGRVDCPTIWVGPSGLDDALVKAMPNTAATVVNSVEEGEHGPDAPGDGTGFVWLGAVRAMVFGADLGEQVRRLRANSYRGGWPSTGMQQPGPARCPAGTGMMGLGGFWAARLLCFVEPAEDPERHDRGTGRARA